MLFENARELDFHFISSFLFFLFLCSLVFLEQLSTLNSFLLVLRTSVPHYFVVLQRLLFFPRPRTLSPLSL